MFPAKKKSWQIYGNIDWYSDIQSRSLHKCRILQGCKEFCVISQIYFVSSSPNNRTKSPEIFLAFIWCFLSLLSFLWHFCFLSTYNFLWLFFYHSVWCLYCFSPKAEISSSRPLELNQNLPKTHRVTSKLNDKQSENKAWIKHSGPDWLVRMRKCKNCGFEIMAHKFLPLTF